MRACGIWSTTQLQLATGRGRRIHVGSSLSRLGAIRITASRSVLARSFTTRASRTVCAEVRWKKVLSLISRADLTRICSYLYNYTSSCILNTMKPVIWMGSSKED
jgi:hypothetical protein